MTWSEVYYDPNGDDFGTDECECYVDAKWQWHTRGCGCCSEQGGCTAADAYPELIRLAERAMKQAVEYRRLAAIAKEQMK